MMESIAAGLFALRRIPAVKLKQIYFFVNNIIRHNIQSGRRYKYQAGGDFHNLNHVGDKTKVGFCGRGGYEQPCFMSKKRHSNKH